MGRGRRGLSGFPFVCVCGGGRDAPPSSPVAAAGMAVGSAVGVEAGGAAAIAGGEQGSAAAGADVSHTFSLAELGVEWTQRHQV